MSESNDAVVHACFADTPSALKVDGQGEGARIQLDVPPQDVPALISLMQKYQGRTFFLAFVDE